MRAGELNRVITLQQKSVTKDADGYGTETWIDIKTVWAAVVATSGREFYAAQKLNAETAILFKIRYIADINTKDRIKYGTRLFDILNINDVNGMRQELQISAREVV